jgi:hypothetical protein
MKKLILKGLLLFLLSNVVGCTGLISSVDPRVINANSQAEVILHKTEANDYVRRDERAEFLHKKFLLSEDKDTLNGENWMDDNFSSNPKSPLYKANGLNGGVPVLIKNVSYRAKTLYMKKTDAPYEGFQVFVTVNGYDKTELTLFEGRYSYYWMIGSQGPYRNKQAPLIIVTPHERVIDTDGGGKLYHGGVILHD